MPWVWKDGPSGYRSPNIERAVKRALVKKESYESVEQRFPTNENLVRESWDFWSKHVPTGLDEAAQLEWIYSPFPVPLSQRRAE